jgi:hypothetical protein
VSKVDKLETSVAVPPLEGPLEKEEDRRLKGQRLYVSFPVVVSYKGNVIRGFIEAQNISWSGMMIATNFPLDVGDRLHLEFTLPNTDLPISVDSRVVYRLNERVPEEATEIGLIFENVETNVQRMISGFVLEHLPHE